MPSIIVLGSVNIDLICRTPALPLPGETVLGGEFQTAGGGKGANQAVAAVKASRGPVVFVAAVGSDANGEQALHGFRACGLDTRFVKRSAKPTGVALIVVDRAGENMIAVASGANLDLMPADVDHVPEDVFRAANVFLAPLESPVETVRRGLERAKAARLTTIFNPAPVTDAQAVLDLLPLVDVLTPNSRELAALAQALGAGKDEKPEQSAARLVERGCRKLVVTLGSVGCLVVENGDSQMIPAHRAQAVDATGAGDAFNGALAVALSEGRSLAVAAAWANRAAAIAVGRAGAQPSLATRAEIEAFGISPTPLPLGEDG